MKQIKKIPSLNDNIKKRFESKILLGMLDGCHYWTGQVDSCGYGVFHIKNSKFSAHRISYIINKGDLKNLLVCHSCDNPSCVNPDHLFLGTHQDNMNDMKRKKRAIGIVRKMRSYKYVSSFNINCTPSSRKRLKLCRISALVIRDANKIGLRTKDIARYFNAGLATIRDVVSGRTWHNV